MSAFAEALMMAAVRWFTVVGLVMIAGAVAHGTFTFPTL